MVGLDLITFLTGRMDMMTSTENGNANRGNNSEALFRSMQSVLISGKAPGFPDPRLSVLIRGKFFFSSRELQYRFHMDLRRIQVGNSKNRTVRQDQRQLCPAQN